MKRNTYFFLLILLTLSLSGCIGTDFVDEPLGPVPTQLELSHPSIVLLEGASEQLSAQVIASDQSTLDILVDWSSRNTSIAAVESDGFLTAVSEGQVWIDVTTQTLADSILVTVSIDPEALASITISASQMNLSIGDSLQLTAALSNAIGMPLTNKVISWESTNSDVCSVDENGLVIALADGNTQIIASSEGLSSLPIPLMVGDTSFSRIGTFQSLNGYNVEGTVTLSGSTGGAIVLMGEDFRSQSGPGLYVYLSPNATNVSGGINLGKLEAQSGVQSYALPDNVNPDDFDHILIYCQPFRVPFGTANFQ
ncbi:MAG: DM13 domain-containing protein [Bacteroidota bacterium]